MALTAQEQRQQRHSIVSLFCISFTFSSFFFRSFHFVLNFSTRICIGCITGHRTSYFVDVHLKQIADEYRKQNNNKKTKMQTKRSFLFLNRNYFCFGLSAFPSRQPIVHSMKCYDSFRNVWARVCWSSLSLLFE